MMFDTELHTIFRIIKTETHTHPVRTALTRKMFYFPFYLDVINKKMDDGDEIRHGVIFF